MVIVYPFLAGLDEDVHEGARLALEVPDLPETERDVALASLLDNDRFSEYLQWKEQEKIPPSQRLLDAVDNNLKKICSIMLENKNYGALRKILKNHSPEIETLLKQIEGLDLEQKSDEKPASSNEKPSDNPNAAPEENVKPSPVISPEPTSLKEKKKTEGPSDQVNSPPPPYQSSEYDSELPICRKTEEFLRSSEKLKGIELLTKTRISISTEKNGQDVATIFGETKDSVAKAEVHFLELISEHTKLMSSPIPLKSELSDQEKIELFKITGCIGINNGQHLSVKFFSRPELEAAKLHLKSLIDHEGPPEETESDRRSTQSIRPNRRFGNSFCSPNYSESDEASSDYSHAPDAVDDTELHFEELPDETVILVIGGTGVGKSTFINSIPNYLKYGDIEDALSDTTVLIESQFHLQERKGNGRFMNKSYVCTPTVRTDHSEENEVLDVGESSTQYPKSYDFKWIVNGVEKRVVIIDTPGNGDCRGTDADAKNFGEIMNFIADTPKIHGILFLVPPNASKLTASFKYCVEELLVHLHHTAINNILFGFTHCKGTDYRPGETFAVLDKLLKDLAKRNSQLSISLDTCFSFENEGFRYLIAKNKGHRFEEDECRSYTYSYQKSRAETRRLFAHVAKMIPHDVTGTLSLNNCRNIIFKLAEPMARIAQNIDLNMKLICDKMKEVETLEADCSNLMNNMYIEQEVLSAKKIDHPKTVCADASCVEYKNVDGRIQTIYKQECHNPCYLKNVTGCAAMDSSYNCKHCKHSWQVHLHIYREIVQTTARVIDPDVANALETKKSGIETRRIFMGTAKAKLETLKQSKEQLTELAAAFTTYVKQSSIVPYSDSYMQYMNFLITQEKAKANISGDDTHYKQLLESKRVYEQQLKLLRETTPKDSKKYSDDDIVGMFGELKAMPCGDLLENIKELDLLAVRETRKFNSTEIPMNVTSGFIVRPQPQKRRNTRTIRSRNQRH